MNPITAQLASQLAFWAITTGFGIAYAWVLRLEMRSQRQQGQIAELRLHVSENYASNAAVQKLSDKLDEALGILNRLVGRQEAAGG